MPCVQLSMMYSATLGTMRPTLLLLLLLLPLFQLGAMTTTSTIMRTSPLPQGYAASSSTVAEEETIGMMDLRRLRRAESILKARVGANLTVVLEGVVNDRNQDAVLRTCEGLGIQNVCIISPPKGMKQQPKSNRYTSSHVTRSASHYLSIGWYTNIADCARELNSQGYEIWVTDLSPASQNLLTLLPSLQESSSSSTSSAGASSSPRQRGGYDDDGHDDDDDDGDGGGGGAKRHHNYAKTVFPEKLAVVFGSEIAGASPEIKSWSHRLVHYPMFGFTESLNLGVAAGIVLATILSSKPDLRGSLSRTETIALRSQWYMALAKTAKQQKLYPQYIKHPPPPLAPSCSSSSSSSSSSAFSGSKYDMVPLSQGATPRMKFRFKPRTTPAIGESSRVNFSSRVSTPLPSSSSSSPIQMAKIRSPLSSSNDIANTTTFLQDLKLIQHRRIRGDDDGDDDDDGGGSGSGGDRSNINHTRNLTTTSGASVMRRGTNKKKGPSLLPPPLLNFDLESHLTDRSSRRIPVSLSSSQNKSNTPKTTSTKPPSFLTTAQYYARGVYGEEKAKQEAFGEPVAAPTRKPRPVKEDLTMPDSDSDHVDSHNWNLLNPTPKERRDTEVKDIFKNFLDDLLTSSKKR